ncbi:GNAT family N-acetyltransferase [Actinophytocola algeriensis]|uniref:Phosphinothricin acetyltransferase n=1 Tax=Actinophytocola algeriensis TaxID=1768010 RepID=A0A7W7Q5N2_9PSEU|nr:GNAT family N-acetyltransferase [Actinophytocola algeriensis]MBB4907357.1 phosphinothricin acetyltransferase [Actinophytocola algeriensis]MBE1478840.1 phosphinothricin acetyltransferase [Actinophytocola algeriensis]
MSTIVRDAVPADAPGVAAVFEPYVRDSVVTFETDPPSVAAWESRLAADLPFVVLTVDGVVKGYAYASPWRPKPAYRHTVETTVYLSADATGQGHGRTLMARLLKRCKENGYRQAVAVVVAAPDESSLRLHEALGYEEAGRLTKVGWKQGQWLDTLLLQREL